VEPGEIVGLLGANGAGKTTAFYMTVGLVQPDAGEVYFGGERVTALPMCKRARMGMGYLSQEPSVFRPLTVEENLLCALEVVESRRKPRMALLEKLLEELHLTPLAKKPASALSGGERRRLEITRALATSPSCLMLDEPFANIDPLSIAEVQALIRLLADRGIGILITDHNAREIFSTVHRSYLVREGRILKAGTVEELVDDPTVRKFYLGEDFRW
ncbi:MAG: LPS export ABC transporter ATP-binding protein, partial [Chlamydiia bacterium]|nr:LPS export ABC transporter ATP-binding protein [Chlamydiia bacterium]